MPTAAIIATQLTTPETRVLSVFIGGRDVTRDVKWDSFAVTDSGTNAKGTASMRLELTPSATKSTDFDRAGRIVDVDPDPGEIMAFVTAELAKHDRYLALIRERVRSGKVRLTAFLAKMLGLPFEDGVELHQFQAPFGREGVSGAAKAMADLHRSADTGLAEHGAVWTPPRKEWVS